MSFLELANSRTSVRSYNSENVNMWPAKLYALLGVSSHLFYFF